MKLEKKISLGEYLYMAKDDDITQIKLPILTSKTSRKIMSKYQGKSLETSQHKSPFSIGRNNANKD